MENIEVKNICVKKFFNEYRHQISINKDLINCNKNLLHEIKTLKENLNEIIEKQQENMYITINSNNSHLLYMNLKEKYNLLLKELQSIKQEKEILVRHYEEKILIHKEEIEKEKRNVGLKENEVCEKLQCYQASIALQNDETESKWQARLHVINQQLKDSNMSCNTLRSQLVDLKNRYFLNNTELEGRIQELEQTLAVTEDKLRRTQEKLLNNQQLNIPTYGATKSNVYTKSKPYSYKLEKINIGHHRPLTNTSVELATETYEARYVSNVGKQLNKSSPVLEVEKSPKKQNKRKLYNADEFE